MNDKELIEAVARAIARKEGFFVKGKNGIPTIAQRCNNPGNLTHWKDPNGKPYPMANGYVRFPDEETGWRALRAQVRINALKRGLTWREFFAGKPGLYAGFCPKDDGRDPLLRKNNPLEYAHQVLQWVAGPDASDINQPIRALLSVSEGPVARAA